MFNTGTPGFFLSQSQHFETPTGTAGLRLTDAPTGATGLGYRNTGSATGLGLVNTDRSGGVALTAATNCKLASRCRDATVRGAEVWGGQ